MPAIAAARLLPALLAAALLALAAGAAGAGEPACFGAAARDAAHPCSNPALAHSVTPTPGAALRQEGHRPFCGGRPVRRAPILVCPYGPVPFTRTIAILGDSHADHLRGAWAVIAEQLGWRIDVVYRPGCPYSRATTKLPHGRRLSCERWNRLVPRFFAAHPEIDTVLTADHVAYVQRAPHHTVFGTQIEGYLAGWRALPASVKRIVVIRDPPIEHFATITCLERALARHQSLVSACTLPRAIALHRDPQVAAAGRLHGRAGAVIDLTRFFCDARRCFPIVGGVLVHRDVNHLSEAYAKTLAPYLQAAVLRTAGT